MPRKGWSVEEDLSRAVWKRILMGPRPPSVQWPSQAKRKQSAVSNAKPFAKGPLKSESKAVRRQSCVSGGSHLCIGFEPRSNVVADSRERTLEGKSRKRRPLPAISPGGSGKAESDAVAECIGGDGIFGGSRGSSIACCVEACTRQHLKKFLWMPRFGIQRHSSRGLGNGSRKSTKNLG